MQIEQAFPASQQSSASFKWRDYSPVVFQHLREVFGLESRDYLLSLAGDRCAAWDRTPYPTPQTLHHKPQNLKAQKRATGKPGVRTDSRDAQELQGLFLSPTGASWGQGSEHCLGKPAGVSVLTRRCPASCLVDSPHATGPDSC